MIDGRPASAGCPSLPNSPNEAEAQVGGVPAAWRHAAPTRFHSGSPTAPQAEPQSCDRMKGSHHAIRSDPCFDSETASGAGEGPQATQSGLGLQAQLRKEPMTALPEIVSEEEKAQRRLNHQDPMGRSEGKGDLQGKAGPAVREMIRGGTGQ